MIAYLVFGAIFLVLNFFMYYNNTTDKKKLIVNGVILVIISGLRSKFVGTDTLAYGKFFEIFGESSLSADVSSDLEGYPGYRLLSKVIYMLTDGNYQIMLFVASAITVYGIFKFIYYYSDNIIASVFYYITLYYFFSSLNISRQFIAMSIALLAVIAFDEKKYLKCCILMLFVIFTHNFACIILIYMVLKKIKWTKLLFSIYSICVVIIMAFTGPLISLFMRIFPRYQLYERELLGNGTIYIGTSQGRKIILSLIFLAFLLLALVAFKQESLVGLQKREKKLSITQGSFYPVAAMTMIENVIGIVFSTSIFYSRIQSIFSIFSIFLLPSVIERLDKKWRVPLYLGTNLMFFAMLVIRMIGGESGIYPYEFFWQV